MLGFIAIGVAGVSLLLNIVGLAIPYWASSEMTLPSLFGKILHTSIKQHSGLWTTCTEIEGFSNECKTQTEVSSDVMATRAFVILAMLVLVGVLVCTVLKLFVLKELTLLPKVAGGCAIAAGVLMIIGAAIYAAKLKGTGFDLHAGFALTIVAAVGSFVSGGLFFIDRGQSFNNQA